MFTRRPPTALEERLGHRFRRRELLEEALTHRSYANENDLPHNYERLELLGDAVLGALTVEWLLKAHPELPEGELSKRKSQLVSARNLARYADSLAIGEALYLGVGEERSGGRSKPSLLADVFEALLGALWLDGGVESARRLVRRLLGTTGTAPARLAELDAKTRLQERAQALGWGLPQYRIAAEEGPDHAKRFRVECWLEGELAGRGEGRSKKRAEQRAASSALADLESKEAATGGTAEAGGGG